MTGTSFFALWKQKARTLKLQSYALYLAARHPRTPWYAKALALLVVAYAFSPIDLIPDFIPVLGYLDDLLLLPLGIALVLALIPGDVMEECRARAKAQLADGRPVYRWMGAVIVAVWVVVIGAVGLALYRAFWG